MTVTAPSHWIRELEGTSEQHPFSRLAWKLHDHQDTLTGEAAEIVQEFVDELRTIERTELMRQHIKRTVRKVKIAKAEPIVVDDTDLKTAYHTAMLNMQLDTDQMSYDRFRLIYDEVVRQIKPVDEDALS